MSFTAPEIEHRDRPTLEAGLARVREAPRGQGRLDLIVRRPEPEDRELLTEGRLDLDRGLAGDCWHSRGSPSTEDGTANPDAQITLMSSRAAALVSGSDEHAAWALAGDQLYVDLDVSFTALPEGSRIAIGEAELEVTAEPHLGCGKFAQRFGVEALKLVNSEAGRALRLRGVNARVVVGGALRVGDEVRVPG